MKTLTALRGMGKADLQSLVDAACSYADGENAPERLSGRSVAMLFFERSTRTRLSFELAASRLGSRILSFDPATSSTGKGESLRDTVLTIAAIGADLFVVRHSAAGVPDQVAEWTGAPVVNAGDGAHEHPTQALVDIVTLSRHFGDLDGLRMAVVGDVRHSRVAGSLIHAMPAMGVELTLVGPEQLLPEDDQGLDRSHSLDEVIADVDVAYLLRVQTERGARVDTDYSPEFGLDGRRASLMRETAVVMHPGPINRGVEISDDVADGPRSLILEQVSNGVPTRMAVLSALESALN